MKLKIGGLYQLKPYKEFTHPYRKEPGGIVVYQIKNVPEKLLESIEFKPGTPVLVVGNTNTSDYVDCLIEDKVYEVSCKNLVKLS
jgi:hypothetical protein